MIIHKFGSATVLVELDDVKILCDPWLTDGAYYGAWCNYPPIDLAQCDFSDVDFVYISHIHPDHFDPKTMALIDTSTPVLIHSYHQKFLKGNIERLGFEVVEIANGEPYSLSENTRITIFAADNCDPSVCGHLFGCVDKDINGSMQLDSLCVIEDGRYTLVNTNDCPFEIGEQALKVVKERHPVIDFALIGYASASLYPHCMMDYTNEEMEVGKDKARRRGLATGLNTLKLLKPEFYMPFAGTYILGGSNYLKNTNLPSPELQDAVEHFQAGLRSENIHSSPVLLNFAESFSLTGKTQSKPYLPICPEKRKSYIVETARHFKYDYEDDPWPAKDELIELFNRSVSRLKKKQLEVSLFEDLNIVFDISDSEFIVINLMLMKPKLKNDLVGLEKYQRFKLDPRLLKRVLSGPRHANWNNIEIGALLEFSRKPDVFRMDVHTLINALHI